MKKFCRVFDLTASKGLIESTSTTIPYLTGFKYQKAVMDKIYTSKISHNLNNSEKIWPDALIILQHSPVYTLGKGGTINNFKFDVSDNTQKTGKEIYRVSRGGEVTWHGPGQLVVYPIIDLTRHKKDLRWYISSLEDTIISTLAHYDIKSNRSTVNPGVWVEKNKICAVGITCSRWITMHGLALNITCDLSSYDQIIPCGISSDVGGVCSMKQFQSNITLNEVKLTLLKNFQQQFHFDEYEIGSREELEQLVHENPAVVEESLTLRTL